MRRDIENIQITSPVMKINFACDRLPEYPGLRTRGYELGQTGGVTIGPSIEYLQRAYEDARQGRPADWPFFSIHAQSAVDRTLAPEGKQTFSIFTQFFPYELAEGTWDERRDEIAKHVARRASPSTRRTWPTPRSRRRCWPRPTSRRASA